jgi:methylamine--corrinoid protein Co-methyltransferase
VVRILDYLEVVDRAMTGERIDEKEYEMRVFKNIQEFVRELKIKPDPENPVPSDDSLADEVFEAGLMLAERIGAYCLDTKRVVKITEDEIRGALKKIPEKITVGAGKDARDIVARSPEDGKLPHIIGAGATPLSEDLHVKIMYSIALEQIDSIHSSNMYKINGRRIVGMPLEVYGTRRAIEWAREAIRRAGKPGMYILGYPLNMRAYVINSMLDWEHIRPTDGVCCSHLPEGFKLEYDVLTATHTAHEYGCYVFDHTSGHVGMYSGGPEGVVIHNVAGVLIGQTLLGYDWVFLTVIYALDTQLNDTPEIFWAKSLLSQALARNTKVKFHATRQAGSEPGCREWFLQATQLVLTWVPAGVTIFQADGRPTAPRRENLCGPLESRWCVELIRAATKLRREEANEVVKKISALFPKEKLRQGQFRGRSFEESYDTTTLKPKKDHLELYENMKKEVADLGVPFSW